MLRISAPFWRSHALENLTEEYLRTYSRPEIGHQRSFVNLKKVPTDVVARRSPDVAAVDDASTESSEHKRKEKEARL